MASDEIEKMWEWIDRPLGEEFWQSRGKYDKAEAQRRFDEIPEKVKPLAYAIIELAMSNKKKGLGGDKPESCRLFRNQIYELANRMKKDGKDIHLPSYWFTDGIMVEPEWIVRITNGIIGWCCDSSVNMCGMVGNCRFYNGKYEVKA